VVLRRGRNSSSVPSRLQRRGTARIAAVQLRKKTRRGEGGLGLEWVDLVKKEMDQKVRKGFFLFLPFFSEFFASSFCHRISGKRKEGEMKSGVERLQNMFQILKF
jgi:hypothetical protein